MKSLIHHSLEGNEDAALFGGNVAALARFVGRHATAEELGVGASGRSVPHPGIKSLRRIKGNLFTDDDVRAMGEFVAELAHRAGIECERLSDEASRIARDPVSAKAYDHLVSSIRHGVDDARRIMADWSLAFVEALGEGPVLDQPARSLAALPS